MELVSFPGDEDRLVPVESESAVGSRPDLEALWDYDDPAGSEARLLDVLPRAEAADDAAYLAELLTRLARTQGLQMRFDEADRTLDRAQSMITPDMPTAKVRLLLERGRVRNSSGDPASSTSLFEEAFETASASGLDELAVDAAHMLGIVEPGEAGIAWNKRALALAEVSADHDARQWRGSLYNNLGWAYHDLGRHDEALEMFESHLRVRTEEGDQVQARVARWSIAKTLRFLGRLEEALAVQTDLLAELQREGGRDGYVNEELAECLLALGREEQARPHFGRAWEILHEDPWLARDDADRLARLAKLGGRS